VIIISLSIFCLYPYLIYGSFSADKSHNKSEKGINYGPSENINKIDIGGSKLLISKFGNYISADIVEKRGLMWFPLNKPYILQIDSKENINYSYFENNLKNDYAVMCIFGIINDDNIKTIKLLVKDNIKNTLKTLDFQIINGKYLLIFWNEKLFNYGLVKIQCFDSNKKNVYEKNLETMDKYNLKQ
jgi:hypothetical protein